ncbi:MAG: hypothetical protein ABDH59_08615, partial [Fervidobacterium sp.]
FERREVYYDYIVNNLSGDYIKWWDQYIRVYTGQRYDLDYTSGKGVYVPSANGLYVKGYDGQYYMTSTFYSKVPHTDIVYVARANVSYALYLNNKLITSESCVIYREIEAVSYKYDPYNNRLLKLENDLSYLVKMFVSNMSTTLSSKIQTPKSLDGLVESVRFPRVLINIGEYDGVKPGTTFGIKKDGKIVGEIKVIRTGADYSECEVTYLKRGYEIRIKDEVFQKQPDFVNSVGFKILYVGSPSAFFTGGDVSVSLSAKEFNIFREEVSSIAFSYTLSFENLSKGNYYDGNFEVNMFFRIFGVDSFSAYVFAGLSTDVNTKSKVGVSFKVGFFELQFFVPLTQLVPNVLVESIKIGGGVSW